MEYVIIALILGAAVLVLARRAARALQGRNNPCGGCACGSSCPANRPGNKAMNACPNAGTERARSLPRLRGGQG